jgi:hypothetical protein
MGDYAWFRWLFNLVSKRSCTANVLLFVLCTVISFAGWETSQITKDRRASERELLLRQQLEMERQAEHKRLLGVIEALKSHRDLSLPAEPDENY